MKNLIQRITVFPTKVVDVMESPGFEKKLEKFAIGLYIATALTLGAAVYKITENNPALNSKISIPSYSIK